MKKAFSLMLLLATMLTFTACGGDDEPENSLAGTIWTRTFSDDLLVLEFVDGTNVEFYGADKNLNISGKTYRGTYSKSGDKVIFSLTGAHYIEIRFKQGLINGNSMDIDCDVDRVVIGEQKWEPETLTFRKH